MARSFQRRGKPFKPSTSWSTTSFTAHQALAANTTVLTGTFTTMGPVTIRRTRGIVAAATDQLAASERVIGAFGMCVVSQEAAAAGAASIPGPFTEAESDLWFVHQYIYSSMVFGDATGFRNFDQQYEVDSKAMRKVTEEEVVAIMVENGTTTGLNWWLGVRILTSAARG